MNEELKEKIVKTLCDKEVYDAFMTADSVETAVSVLKGAGVEVTVEELATYMESIEDDDELTEENLDDVAGGITLGIGTIVLGSAALAKVLKCNQHTNWGKNGKKCICGYHTSLKNVVKLLYSITS